MEMPCVRVEREEGETTRTALAERGILADDAEIIEHDGWLYIPINDPNGLDEYEVLTREVPRRERPEMPASILGFEPSYERLGGIVILDEDDPDRAHEIGRAVMDSGLPVRTVLNRASKVQGELRVREWDLIEGESTETVHREYGFEYALDLAAVYFSPRLATERHRVTEQVRQNECVFDMFAGVGPFVIPAASRGAQTVGVDLNHRAIEYLHENTRRNGVSDRVTAIYGDVRETVPEYEGWAGRIVMNLPHSANEFLDTAVSLAGEECVIHYYDIAHDEDPFGPGERAIHEAATANGYDVHVETRHVVRSYAPHELNVCLDVRLS